MSTPSLSRLKLRVQPDLVPLSGLILLLVVTYMVVAPALCGGFVPSAPLARTGVMWPEQRTDITLGIDRDGNYYLNRRTIDSQNLEAALRRAFAARPDEYVLYVWADAHLDYGVIEASMDLARRCGARVVGLIVFSQYAEAE